MLNLDRLRALHAVAAHGSIHAAAETLHVTTSAVSQQLAKLEREIGQPLLEKQGRGVRLTDAGRAAGRAHAERVLSLLEEAEAELEADRRHGRRADHHRRVRHRSARAGAAGAARRCAKRYPQLRSPLHEQEPRESASPLLVRRDVDLVIAQRLAERADRAARGADQGAADG